MRIGPRLEATRHLLGELTLTLSRQPRHHFPKQGRGTPTGPGAVAASHCSLSRASRRTSSLITTRKAYVTCRGTVRTKTSNRPKTEGAVRCLNSAPAWQRIRELHAERFGSKPPSS